MATPPDMSSLRVDAPNAPVRKQTISTLREAILSRHFLAGERLRERQLCELTGVSRTSLREALRQLESENLVRALPRGGVVVSGMSERDIRELYMLRTALEGLAGSECARKASSAHVEALERAVDDFAGLGDTAEIEEYARVKADFYRALYAGADNELLERTIEGFRARVAYLQKLTMSYPGRTASTLEEIRSVVAAVARGDAEAAREACEQHISAAATYALRAAADDAARASRDADLS